MPYDFILAAALLAAPPGTPEIPPQDTADLVAAIRQIAIEQQILDPAERIFYDRDYWQRDIDELRERKRDLIDAPWIAEAERFVSFEMAQRAIEFNRAYGCRLRNRLGWHPENDEANRQALRECDIAYKVWDRLRDARSPFYHVQYKRKKLAELRELIGRESFDRGELPDFVPSWNFVEMSR